MKIKTEFNEDGENLQEIIEENLLDFYYEFYEVEIV